jgi:hypothetical protein
LALPIVASVMVYLGAALTVSLLDKSSFGLAMLTITVLLYPHLLMLTSRHFLEHSAGAKHTLLLSLSVGFFLSC